MGHKWRVTNPWNLKLLCPNIIEQASGGRLTAYFLLLLINNERFWQTRSGIQRQWEWIVDAAADVSSQRLIHQVTFASSVWPSDYETSVPGWSLTWRFPDTFSDSAAAFEHLDRRCGVDLQSRGIKSCNHDCYIPSGGNEGCAANRLLFLGGLMCCTVQRSILLHINLHFSHIKYFKTKDRARKC